MTTAILLAAGHSQRFGRDKPTFVLGRESLAQRCLRQALAAGVHRFVVVANGENQEKLREQMKAIWSGDVNVCAQDGDEAPASVLTGLAQASDDDVLLCCTNDVVPDGTYTRVLSRRQTGPALTVATTRLKWLFTGGILDLDGNDRVLRIIERPPGGCCPGAPVNIFVHRYEGGNAVSQLHDTLMRTRDYEATVNELIAAGLPAHVVHVDRWVGIKSREDVQRAQAEFPDQFC